MANIRLREYTSMMISARRVSRRSSAGECSIDQKLLVKLLDTLDELSGIDTSVPNKVTVKGGLGAVPR